MRRLGEPLRTPAAKSRRAEVDGPHGGRSRRGSRARAGRASPRLRWSRGRAVEDQHAVEVVHLVLDDARLEAGGLDRRSSSPCSSCARTRTCTGRSTSTSTPGRLRQPSSKTSSSSLAPLDLGVDQRVDGAVGLDAVDEQAVQDADLRRRQADARASRPSAPPMRATSRAQRVVEALTGRAFALQHRIAELAHLARARRGAARATSGSSGGGSCSPSSASSSSASCGCSSAIDRQSERMDAYCGSTSTLKRDAAVLAVAPRPRRRPPRPRRPPRARSRALTTTWRARGRAGGTAAPGRARPGRSRARIARRGRVGGARALGAEQTTRISVENGG